MDTALSLLNQPIVITLVSLLVGGFLINFISERRARENRLREKKIEFISEVARDINLFLPNLYEPLRIGKLGINQDISDSVKEIMATRMTVQIGSQAFLRSETFYQQYNIILDELLVFIYFFSEASSSKKPAEMVAKVMERRNRLGNLWPLEEARTDTEGKLNEEFIVWLDMIMHRATDLLSSSLEESIR